MRSEHEVYHQLREYELDVLHRMELYFYCGLTDTPTIFALNRLAGIYLITRAAQHNVLAEAHSSKEMP